jgi:uncharacterized protein YcsI (UPF0317 family)
MQYATAQALRRAIRGGEFRGPTPGEAPGFVQTNLVILPSEAASEFGDFCRLNNRPCPLVWQGAAGDWRAAAVAEEADLRTDVPRYRVFRHGEGERDEPEDISSLWQDDFVAFLIGCSFTFEAALVAAGIGVRHLDECRNVPMYRTNRVCQRAGRFAGPLVVSMRPFDPKVVDQVVAITSQFPRMHGGPVHIGDPAAIGISDLARPDFGDAVTVRAGEVPVFWACGVTPQLALLAARPAIALTHSPGRMFVTDLSEAAFREI